MQEESMKPEHDLWFFEVDGFWEINPGGWKSAQEKKNKIYSSTIVLCHLEENLEISDLNDFGNWKTIMMPSMILPWPQAWRKENDEVWMAGKLLIRWPYAKRRRGAAIVWLPEQGAAACLEWSSSEDGISIARRDIVLDEVEIPNSISISDIDLVVIDGLFGRVAPDLWLPWSSS